ncbi:MAG: GCN5-related N-acetyltransferase [Frankiales bacterium]|jgi:predicted GNAT family acetyltransferase|nr:GCN5-related N-acetyltransferase [Frankiales bacterium]
MADVTHSPDTSRFESGAAYLSYERTGDTLDVQHTIVPAELEGQGVGGALVREAVAYAKAEGLTVQPSCSFARAWLERHADA